MAFPFLARLTLIRTIAALYVIIVVLVGTLTALGTHLQPNFDSSTPIYIAYNAVHVYTNGLSILFILYLFYTLYQLRKNDDMLPADSMYNKTGHPIPILLKKAKPVSRYQRSAITVFGLTAIVYDGIRLVETIKDDNALECTGELNITSSAVRIVLHICIIVFILLHHQDIINTNVAQLKWGFLHLIATMLVDYTTMITVEAYEGIVHSSHSEDHSSNSTNETHHAVEKRETDHETNCVYDPDLLNVKLLPYFLPFIVEFVLLGAATIYKIFEQVGMPVTKEILHTEYRNTFEKVRLIAGRVLFAQILGWTILLATAAGTIFFIYTVEEGDNASNDDQDIATYLLYAMNISLNTIGVIVIVASLPFMNRVPFTGHAHSFIDQVVLIVTIFGFYLLIGFNFLPYLNSFTETNLLGDISKLGTTEVIVSYIQSSLQLLFFMDAFRRGTQPVWEKNSRAPDFTMVLFFVNLSLWLISSFLLKDTSENVLMTDYYGTLTWNIVLYITLPLAVFFRFHSTICLVDIMLEIWMPDKIS